MNNDNPFREQVIWYVLPFLLFMFSTLFAATPVDEGFADLQSRSDFEIQAVCQVVLQSILVLGCVAIFFRQVIKAHPLRVSWLAVVVGLLGAGLWISICQMHWESSLIRFWGLDSYITPRQGINPFASFDRQGLLVVFIVARFLVLAVAVPIAEEWMLRGFLARYFDGGDQWYEVRLCDLSLRALWLVVAYSVLSHPQEAMAAFVWFSLINWLMKQHGQLWDCIVAHAVTNFLLGLFILYSGQWHLW